MLQNKLGSSVAKANFKLNNRKSISQETGFDIFKIEDKKDSLAKFEDLQKGLQKELSAGEYKGISLDLYKEI